MSHSGGGNHQPYSQAATFASRAVAADAAGDYATAVTFYLEAASNLQQAVSRDPDRTSRKDALLKLDQYVARASTLSNSTKAAGAREPPRAVAKARKLPPMGRGGQVGAGAGGAGPAAAAATKGLAALVGQYRGDGTSTLAGEITADGHWVSPANGSVELIGIPDAQRWPVTLAGDTLTVTGGGAKGTVFAVRWAHASPDGVASLQIGPFNLRMLDTAPRVGAATVPIPPTSPKVPSPRALRPSSAPRDGGSAAARSPSGGRRGGRGARPRPNSAPVAEADKDRLVEMLSATQDAANVDSVELTFQMDGVTYTTTVPTGANGLLRALQALGTTRQRPPPGPAPSDGSRQDPEERDSSSRPVRLTDTDGGGGDGGGGDGGQPPPPPQGAATAKDVAPATDKFGRIVGGQNDYHQDSAVQTEGSKDSGKYYREKDWADLVRKPADAVGPKQIPLKERVTLGERAEMIAASRYGTRVNPASKERGYSLEGTEKEAFIDPRRNLDDVAGRKSSTAPVKVPLTPKAIEATVLFETTAVGAKLRNTHKVGGERVKEMDHFVASVETPKVVTQTPDVAPYVLNVAMKGLAPVDLDGGLELYAQDNLRDPATGGVAPRVGLIAAAFHAIVTDLMLEVYQRDPQLLRVFYVATMRADKSVAAFSEEDGMVWVNLMAFQQSQCFDPDTGKLCVPAKRPYLYWAQRLGMELAKLDAKHGKPLAPTGLYDRATRKRFEKLLKTRGGVIGRA